jgi:D-lactate dehydrogenase (quinone)
VDSALASGLISGLGAVLGPNGLLLDAAERLAYSYDNSRRQSLPAAVALPTTREQVLAIVRLCREHKTPITARGRGSCIADHAQ